MRGPYGVITVNNNMKRSLRIEKQTTAFATKVQAAEAASRGKARSGSPDPTKHQKSIQGASDDDFGIRHTPPEDQMDATSQPIDLDPK